MSGFIQALRDELGEGASSAGQDRERVREWRGLPVKLSERLSESSSEEAPRRRCRRLRPLAGVGLVATPRAACSVSLPLSLTAFGAGESSEIDVGGALPSTPFSPLALLGSDAADGTWGTFGCANLQRSRRHRLCRKSRQVVSAGAAAEGERTAPERSSEPSEAGCPAAGGALAAWVCAATDGA